MGKLEGKVALVTGGNSGIGLATAREFVAEGAYVFITGRREKELAVALLEIGKNISGVRADVASSADLDRLFSKIKSEKGKLDIVFANAGVAKYAPLGEISEELYDVTFGINVKGILFTVQKALPLIPDGGSIILNSSIVGSKGLPANSVYSATKAAIRSFARTWTTDLKARHIRVNAVSPGATDTPGLNELLGSGEVGQQRLKFISSTVPLGRLAKPEEIARAVVFLASDDSSYVTKPSCSWTEASRKYEQVRETASSGDWTGSHYSAGQQCGSNLEFVAGRQKRRGPDHEI
jgi:NAD(P)-dependent dehydrogenase (short-subunit alcohol dehydrogenase family)